MTSVLSQFDCYVFDVDRTIAPNGDQIAAPILQKLQKLIQQTDIAIVTSRSIHDGLELLAHGFIGKKTDHSLYFFPCSAAQAYEFDFSTGALLKRYDKAKGDVSYQHYYQSLPQSLDLIAHEAEKTEIKWINRGAQITLFFPNPGIRKACEVELNKLNVGYIQHGRSTLHVVPKGIDKSCAINYLEKDHKRFLVFADAFYDEPDAQRLGNDLALTQFSPEKVTCINVGSDQPKSNSGVYYRENSEFSEWKLTNDLLDKILADCDWSDLKLRSA